MTPVPFDYTIRVGYADTDRMGFAHHSRYAVWFESARTEFLRAMGDSYKAWEDRGLLLPVVDLGTTFKQPVYYDDMLHVYTSITDVTRLRLSFRYEVHADGRSGLLALGYTSHVFMNKENRPTRAGSEVVRGLESYLVPKG